MKINQLTTIAAGLAFAAILGTSAYAQSNPGDVILGFKTSGGAYTYEVDLGAATQFLTPSASPETFSLDSSDLSTYVSPTWPTNTSVQWGLIGGTQPQTSGDLTLGTSKLAANTLFVTWNTWAPAPVESSYAGQAQAQAKYDQLVAGYDAPDSGGGFGDATNGTYYATGSKDTVGFDVLSAPSENFLLPSGAGFNNSIVDYNTDASVSVPTSATLDFYELTPTNADTGAKAVTLLGTFNLSDTNGNPALTFTAVSAPEPSTYLMIGLGILALVWRQRGKAASI